MVNARTTIKEETITVTKEELDTIKKALGTYASWMSGFSRVNHTFGDDEASQHCASERHKAEHLLAELENNK